MLSTRCGLSHRHNPPTTLCDYAIFNDLFLLLVFFFFNHNKMFAFLCMVLVHLSVKGCAILSISLDGSVWKQKPGSVLKKEKNTQMDVTWTSLLHQNHPFRPPVLHFHASYEIIVTPVTNKYCHFCNISEFKEWATPCFDEARKAALSTFARLSTSTRQHTHTHAEDRCVKIPQWWQRRCTLGNAPRYLCCVSSSVLWATLILEKK